MAFIGSDLLQIDNGGGFGLYRYDTLDPLATVDGSGYFNNSDDDIQLRVGDIIDVVVWTTAVRTGTINDVGKVIVMTVTAAGVVDVSDDLLGASVTVGD